MSDLQLSLLAIGALFIGGVFVFNRLQERKHKDVADETFPPSDEDQEDVLLNKTTSNHTNSIQKQPDTKHSDDFKPEPENHRLPEKKSSSGAFQYEQPHQGNDLNVNPNLTSNHFSQDYSQTPQATDIPKVPRTILDRDLFFKVYVEVIADQQLISNQEIWTIHNDLKQVGTNKVIMIAGYNLQSQQWERVTYQHERFYHKIVAGLLLVDRSGTVSLEELQLFYSQFQLLTQNHPHALVDADDDTECLERALELDRFCAYVDIGIGLNIFAPENSAGFEVGAIDWCMNQFQMTYDEHSGSYKFLGADQSVQFTIMQYNGDRIEANQPEEKINAITFLLEVPTVKSGLVVFETMSRLAIEVSRQLDGILVNDEEEYLDEEGINVIRRQLENIYNAMEQAHLPAGHESAMLLFN